MKYRSNLDITYEILQAANTTTGRSRTKIMYKAFLSHGPLKEYVDLLTQTDFLRYDKDTRTYKTTEKGLRFLDIYKWIIDATKISRQQQPPEQLQPPQQVHTERRRSKQRKK
jgi:predicted transcriptional regulator